MDFAFVTLFWTASCYLLYTASALNCYMCPPTAASSVDDANIECLALGWEMSCSPEQDRCFSRTHLSSSQVEKGCTKSENCIETTSCCQSQYCNGDPMTSSTGYGQPCDALSNCIQGPEVMRCALEVSGDVTKRCLCTENSYRRGATCKRKSFPDEACMMTSQCSDVNTTCVSGLCQCDPGMYSNVTRCDSQVGLGYRCTIDKQCGGTNTQCAGEFCSCAYGYDVINGTDSCSGGPFNQPVATTHLTSTVFVLLFVSVLR